MERSLRRFRLACGVISRNIYAVATAVYLHGGPYRNTALLDGSYYVAVTTNPLSALV